MVASGAFLIQSGLREVVIQVCYISPQIIKEKKIGKTTTTKKTTDKALNTALFPSPRGLWTWKGSSKRILHQVPERLRNLCYQYFHYQLLLTKEITNNKHHIIPWGRGKMKSILTSVKGFIIFMANQLLVAIGCSPLLFKQFITQ